MSALYQSVADEIARQWDEEYKRASMDYLILVCGSKAAVEANRAELEAEERAWSQGKE